MTLQHPCFKLARNISFKSTDRFKIGAVVAKGKRIISVGYNQMHKTHPRMYKQNPKKKLHAELHAIIGIYKTDLTNATVYVYRERLDGLIGLSKPCIYCQVILEEAGIKKVFFTDPNELNYIGQMRL